MNPTDITALITGLSGLAVGGFAGFKIAGPRWNIIHTNLTATELASRVLAGRIDLDQLTPATRALVQRELDELAGRITPQDVTVAVAQIAITAERRAAS